MRDTQPGNLKGNPTLSVEHRSWQYQRLRYSLRRKRLLYLCRRSTHREHPYRDICRGQCLYYLITITNKDI